jgi:serine/threonine-protein kinase
MADARGVCPSCETAGAVGEPCSERGCARRGYHRIPVESLAQALATAGRHGEDALDPRVGLRLDEYLIVDRLGAGGFGKVYLALQLPIELRAALKLMERPPGAPDPAVMVRKFEDEARALARLTHSNIVRLYKYGSFGGAPYLVMEYVVGGRTLRTEISERALRGAVIDAGLAERILVQVLNALEAAHRAGIIHRDIKPENVMLQEEAGDPFHVRVVDFGLAKFTEEGGESSLFMGTPMYLAPEQLLRRPVGPWTDFYALGVMSFELLTGRRAFGGRTAQEILAKKLDPDYDPLAELTGGGVPAEAARAFFRQALARDPEQRYRTAAEFAQGLGAACAAYVRAGTAQAGDISGLVDSEDIARLRAEQEQLARERRALEDERRRLLEARDTDVQRVATSRGAVSAGSALTSSARTSSAWTSTASRARHRGALIAAGAITAAVVLGVVLALWSRPASSPAPAETERAAPAAIASPATEEAAAPGEPPAGPSLPPPAGSAPEPAPAEVAAPAPPAEPAAPAPPAEPVVPPPPAEAAAPAPPAGMTFVPGGSYTIGCQEGDAACFDDERPPQTVTLAAFALDIDEVTAGAYARCVADGHCPSAGEGPGCTVGRAGLEEHPANCVGWDDARAFCAQRGGRLPREAEWEVAARGAAHPDHPWGDEPPTCALTAMASAAGAGCGTGHTLPVGSRPRDVAACGARDLGGGVREWVDADYAPYPGGRVVETSEGKVNRGGSWQMTAGQFATAHTRGVDPADTRRPDLGFRCAADP